jgi:hypothetical protein
MGSWKNAEFSVISYSYSCSISFQTEKQLFVKQLLLIPFLIAMGLVAQSQNYVGYQLDDIKELMAANYKEFHFTKEVKSEKHHFIKYEDYDGMKTLLFVFDETTTCEYSVQMYDYALLKSVVDSLNKVYEVKANDTWLQQKNGKAFLLKLKKKEWFFSVVTRQKPDETME